MGGGEGGIAMFAGETTELCFSLGNVFLQNPDVKQHPPDRIRIDFAPRDHRASLEMRWINEAEGDGGFSHGISWKVLKRCSHLFWV
jgi:hypothetical protein